MPLQVRCRLPHIRYWKKSQTDKKNDTKIFIAELNYDLLKTKFKEEITYTPESTFVKTSRDIAMIVDKKVECGDIIAAIEKADKLVSEVDLFDIFESEKLGFGKKSMAFRIVFASHEFDVTDEMTDKAVDGIVNRLRDVYGALMRS